jgi:dihydrofolate synthase / folylpolyglutamate synthase
VNYETCLQWMFNSLPMYQRQGKAAYKADLNRTIEIDRICEYPHQAYKTIHVAGTNGKGSVSHMLASIFQEAGYKTGLYTSPHLKDFRERIKINGEMIPESYVLDFILTFKETFQNLEASFFEMTVALAFQYFKDEKVDIAIIETGMGGRLDSTNIIIPELSIITNIGLDHTAFLGDNLIHIAGEKAGIIKHNIPVISGSDNNFVNEVFLSKVNEMNSRLMLANLIYKKTNHTYSNEESKYCYLKAQEKICLESDLNGFYQHDNIRTVLTAFDYLSTILQITTENLREGLKNVIRNTRLQGRWQKLSDNPLIYCDVAHNKDGISIVMEQISTLKFKQLYIVLGVVNDKDLGAILSLFPKEAKYVFTQADIPRALPVDTLKNEAEKFSLFGESVRSVKDAIEYAKTLADEDDLIFVGGSTFVVAEIL